MGKVEERLWSIIRNFATLGKEQPAMLVNAVRIIELQEMVDKQLEASGKSMQFRLGPYHSYFFILYFNALDWATIPIAQDSSRRGVDRTASLHAYCRLKASRSSKVGAEEGISQQ